MSIGP
ncbi:29d8c771-f3a5-4cb0-8d1a-1946edbede11 [Thermothielavioides terrestris]